MAASYAFTLRVKAVSPSDEYQKTAGQGYLPLSMPLPISCQVTPCDVCLVHQGPGGGVQSGKFRQWTIMEIDGTLLWQGQHSIGDNGSDW